MKNYKFVRQIHFLILTFKSSMFWLFQCYCNIIFLFYSRKRNNPKLPRPRGADQACDVITYDPYHLWWIPLSTATLPTTKTPDEATEKGCLSTKQYGTVSPVADTREMLVKGRSRISAHGKLVEVEVAKDILFEWIELSCSSFKFV